VDPVEAMDLIEFMDLVEALDLSSDAALDPVESVDPVEAMDLIEFMDLVEALDLSSDAALDPIESLDLSSDEALEATLGSEVLSRDLGINDLLLFVKSLKCVLPIFLSSVNIL
jgi:hypothetical protein